MTKPDQVKPSAAMARAVRQRIERDGTTAAAAALGVSYNTARSVAGRSLCKPTTLAKIAIALQAEPAVEGG